MSITAQGRPPETKPRLRRTAAAQAPDAVEMARQVISEAEALLAAQRRRLRGSASAAALGAAERALLEQLVVADSLLTVPALARHKGVSRQSVQTLVDRLRSRGYLTPLRNPAHRRSPLLALTEAGRQVLRDARNQEAAAVSAVASTVTPAELEAARDVLRRLRTKTSE